MCSLAVFHLLWWAAAWILPLSVSAFVPVNHCAGRSKLTRFQLDAMQVTIRIVGKKSGGEKWIDEACSMYQTRLRPANIDVETTFLKSDDALVKAVEGDYSKGNAVVLLDPEGKTCTSEKLAVDVYKWLEAGGSRLVFVIGGGTKYIGRLPGSRSSCV